MLRKYNSILVREKSAVDIIKSVGYKGNVELVLDPTLLLKKDEWISLIDKEKNKIKKEKEPYVLVYQLHHNKKFDEYVKLIKRKTKLKIKRINTSIFFGLKPGELVLLPTIAEFLYYIENAKYVLTDSFHGTVFSIIFNKKMVDILPKVTGTRIESILELFGIKNRILKNYNDISIMDQEIDFDKINKKLDSEREKSLKSLKDSLNN